MLCIQTSPVYIKNIVAGITCECFMKGVQVAERLAQFVLMNELVNPDHNLSYEKARRKEELERLTDACVERLVTADPLTLRMLNLQSYFSLEFGGDENVAHEHRELLLHYLEPMMRSIVRMEPQSQADYGTLFRQIVMTVVLLSGMGNPLDPNVYNEAEVALNSILPLKSLETFVRHSEPTKRRIISESEKLVTGIRLFNKDRKKGGYGIEDLPPLIMRGLIAADKLFTEVLELTRRKIAPLERLMERCVYWGWNGRRDMVVVEPPQPLDRHAFGIAKGNYLIQQLVINCIKVLLIFVKFKQKKIPELTGNLNDLINTLKNDVSFRIAVPTTTVYPQFIKIASIWQRFQNAIVLLSVYERAMNKVYEFVEIENIPEALQELLKSEEEELAEKEKAGESVYTGKEEWEEGLIEQSRVQLPVVYLPSEEQDTLPLMFGGFDPIYMVDGEGLAMRAHPGMGVLKHSSAEASPVQYIGFKHLKSAYLYGSQPLKYFEQILEFARRNPLYIDLLQLREEIGKYQGQTLSPLEKQKVGISEQGIQTELHPLQTNMDRSYTHSVWQLRTQAIHLTNITKKRTHSSQTVKSYFSEGIGVQTFDFRDSSCQTMRDNSSNTPGPATFLYGVRGGERRGGAHLATLTRRVDEDCICTVDPTWGLDRRGSGMSYRFMDPCLETALRLRPSRPSQEAPPSPVTASGSLLADNVPGSASLSRTSSDSVLRRLQESPDSCQHLVSSRIFQPPKLTPLDFEFNLTD